MHSSENQVRVFISSTFRDMHAERDHLVTVVFPELRERVERLGLEFFDVDLRWGVPAKDADGETANSWEYCRQWIDRVEPFFVCMLGQRYGWVPEPGQLKSEKDRQRQQKERRSITDMEIRYAVLATKLKRRSYFYLRVREAPATATEYVDPPPLLEKLERLKAEVRTCGRPVWDYPCEWTGTGFSGMEEFGRRVLDDLWSGVLRDERYVGKEVWRQVLGTDPDNDPGYTDETIPVPRELWEKIVALAKPPPKDPLDAEREQMDSFAASRLRWFQGRTEELETLAGFIGSTSPDDARLAVVAAVPGQGKSALIAKLGQSIQDSGDRSQNPPFLITHFVGATERSASAHALVGRLLAELDRSGIVWPADEQKEGEEPKQDFNSQCLRLAKRLGDYAGEQRIVLLLDALNQLSDGHDLNWLPQRLGPNVRVVVSCVDDPAAQEDGPESKVLHALESRQPAPVRVPVGPLTEEDVRVIVVAYLLEYCKELDTPHVETICATPQARNPLYLLVMLGELRTLGGNEMNEVVPKLLASMVTDYPDTVALFRWVLQRLEVFGSEEVKWWCLYLAHGRVGMASHELADLLARKLGSDAAATALLIERGLRRYLLRRGGQLDFFHGQLRQAVMEQYGLQAEPAAVHREMADYFTTCAKGTDPQKEWDTDCVRGFSECVFHLTKAGQHELAAGFLSNFPFILHKLRVGLLEGVFEDYDMVRCEAPAEIVNQLEIWSAFFRETAHILRRGNDEWPAHKILLQLAVEHADDSPLTIGAERWLADGRCDWIWLCRNRRLPHVQVNPCLAVLEGHTDFVCGALALTDGRLLSWSGGGSQFDEIDYSLRLWDERSGACLMILDGLSAYVTGTLALGDGRLLIWSEDKQVRLWDGRSSESLTVLEGPAGRLWGARELADGRLLSWADETLLLWECLSGERLTVLKGHTGGIRGALELGDGRLLSWSEDKTLRVWDGQSGKCLSVLEGHTDWIYGARELADGRLLSWSSDGTLRLWDGRHGMCLTVLEGHTTGVSGALEVAGGRLLSWPRAAVPFSKDMALRLWDSHNGTCLATIEGHTGRLDALALSNGRLLSWSWPGGNMLRLWDGQNGICLHVLEGHTGWVYGARELVDGRLLSWSADGTLRLWDGHSGMCLTVFEGHTRGVLGALELTNGRLLSWSEDKTLRLWDPSSNGGMLRIDGHTDRVWGTLVLADERLLSWSEDRTLRLWDSHSGLCLAVLKGHAPPTIRVEGALALTDGSLLSWASDELRLWDGESGECLAVLEGHRGQVRGALELAYRRVLSWADETLRLWDAQSGECLAVLKGHTSAVMGAIALANSRLVSWSDDKTLRLWDGKSGACLAILEGHNNSVNGALLLADGRLLSWSNDKTMRLWNVRCGTCLAIIEGHDYHVVGAVELTDGRLLSWSGDKTIRLWDRHSGICLKVLEGHTHQIWRGLELADGRLLSWSRDKTWRLWDSRDGTCLEVVADNQVTSRHPEWIHHYDGKNGGQNVAGNFFSWSSMRLAHLCHRGCHTFPAAWCAESECYAPCLLSDGTLVVTQANGQVCILKLHHGHRRITLAEAEAILVERGDLPAINDHLSLP